MSTADPWADASAMIDRTLSASLPDFMRYCSDHRDELDRYPFRTGLLIAVGGFAETATNEGGGASGAERSRDLAVVMRANADRLERTAKRHYAENRPGGAAFLNNAAQLLRDAADELKLAAGFDEGA